MLTWFDNVLGCKDKYLNFKKKIHIFMKTVATFHTTFPNRSSPIIVSFSVTHSKQLLAPLEQQQQTTKNTLQLFTS
jgi:hypothetical protein